MRIKKQTSYKAVFSLLVVKKHNLLTLLRRSTQEDKKREKESREVLLSYRDTCYVATMKRQNFENGAEAKQLPVSERRLGQRVNI